jgi:hypothetical protein
MKQFDLANNSPYLYYKLIITALPPATTILISEIQMLLSQH